MVEWWLMKKRQTSVEIIETLGGCIYNTGPSAAVWKYMRDVHQRLADQPALLLNLRILFSLVNFEGSRSYRHFFLPFANKVLLLWSWAVPAVYTAALPSFDDGGDLTFLYTRKGGKGGSSGGGGGGSSSSSKKSTISTAAIIAIVVVILAVLFVGWVLWKCVLPRVLAKRKAKKEQQYQEQVYEHKVDGTAITATTTTPQVFQSPYQQPTYPQPPYGQNSYGPPAGPPPPGHH
jgi:preprotein translocase subunit SecG